MILEGKRVAVTGAAGFIGRYVVGCLLDQGATVDEWDVANVPQPLDLEDARSVRDRLKREHPDAIVHLAAAGVRHSAAHDPKCICKTPEQHPVKHDERRGTIDRNAQFHSLSSEEREHLRCIEYQAVRLLSYVVPIYIVTWQILGCITIGTWMAVHGRAAAEANSVTPWYVDQVSSETESDNVTQVGGSLLCFRKFQQCWLVLAQFECGKHDSGLFTAYSDGLKVPFQKSAFFLIVMAILMLAGNTA